VVVAVLAAGRAEPYRAFASDGRSFADDAVPWTFTFPSDWEISTNRSEPDPGLKAGVLSTHVASVGYPLGGASSGPNSGGGASAALGSSAAVLKVQLLWYPANEPIPWNAEHAATTVGTPGRWHDDAQNPGWVFRERRVCLERACVWVLEWHGPDATEDAIGWLERIAGSVELQPDWTDPI
jgi:hypothetical protein